MTPPPKSGTMAGKMKFTALAAMLVMGLSAVGVQAQNTSQRFVEGVVVNTLENVRNRNGIIGKYHLIDLDFDLNTTNDQRWLFLSNNDLFNNPYLNLSSGDSVELVEDTESTRSRIFTIKNIHGAGPSLGPQWWVEYRQQLERRQR